MYSPRLIRLELSSIKELQLVIIGLNEEVFILYLTMTDYICLQLGEIFVVLVITGRLMSTAGNWHIVRAHGAHGALAIVGSASDRSAGNSVTGKGVCAWSW